MERPLKHPSEERRLGLVQTARLHRSRMATGSRSLDLFAGQEQVLQALAAAGQ